MQESIVKIVREKSCNRQEANQQQLAEDHGFQTSEHSPLEKTT